MLFTLGLQHRPLLVPWTAQPMCESTYYIVVDLLPESVLRYSGGFTFVYELPTSEFHEMLSEKCRNTKWANRSFKMFPSIFISL